MDLSRRNFLIGSVATGVATMAPGVFAQGSSTIKVGLIGCGGRGTDATINCFNAAPGIQLWAMGDAFEDRLNGSAGTLQGTLKDAFKVTADRKFSGLDAYKKVLASGCDLVILATPPGFRPLHYRAAIEANKHVFMEKPVATDAAGIRSVLETGAMADAKKLSVVSGTQRRHDPAYLEIMKRIHDGAIGDVVALYAYWNQGGLWQATREAKWTDLEFQMRNWLYFTYLSGDHIVEQHIHNLDVANWAMKTHPVKAVGLGGRQVRTDAAYGHIFDHFGIEFEYENGVRLTSMARQQDGTAARVAEHIVGTKGSSNAGGVIRGEKAYRYDGARPNPYVEEHKFLIEAIRAGKQVNETQEVAHSTLTAIMGRMAAYTGQEVTWDQALNSTEVLMPATLAFGPMPVGPVAMPGKTELK
ncbi:MAG: Gfo/Idh/MocA family protein [Fimbriimonas sp.]